MKEVGSSLFPKHPQPMQRKVCVGICKQMAVPLGDLVYEGVSRNRPRLFPMGWLVSRLPQTEADRASWKRCLTAEPQWKPLIRDFSAPEDAGQRGLPAWKVSHFRSLH